MVLRGYGLPAREVDEFVMAGLIYMPNSRIPCSNLVHNVTYTRTNASICAAGATAAVCGRTGSEPHERTTTCTTGFRDS
jgi:hypothetical protein